MIASPHSHVESPLTGSTVSAMISHAKEMGRTHFAVTDNGHLSSVLKAYNLCQPDKKSKKEHLKKKLQLIPGIEFYFKDLACPITVGTSADRCQYFTASIYCENQESYQELCKTVSRTNFPVIDIHEESQNLWSWDVLAHLSKFKVNLVLGGIHCMVGKVMLSGNADLAEQILVKLKDIFKDNLYVSLVCEPWEKKYSQIIEIKHPDGTRTSCLSTDHVSTDKVRRIKASELLENSRHSLIKSVYQNNSFKNVNKIITSTKLHKGFLPLPGGDAMAKVNRFLKIMADKHHIPLLASDYAYYANKEDKIVQTMRLEGSNKLQPNFHMKTEEEIRQYLCKYLNFSTNSVDAILSENIKWANRFNNLTLKYDWRLADPGEDPLKKAMQIIKENGRMKWDNPVWVDRLKEELNVIAKNPKKDLTAYFLPIRDVLNHYKENGQLTGPGRGSAGGSLFCYLLGITQVNPFQYDLPFNRFFSLERIMMNKLPDIDVDLPQRELLVGKDGKSGYLYGRWGDKAAQISTRTTIRLKSAIKDTNRYFNGKVEDSVENFTKGLPAPPQGVSDSSFIFGFTDEDDVYHPGLIEQSEDLKKYANSRPKEWDIVSKAMGITRAFSRHASAFVLSDLPIKEIVPTKEGNITQYEAREAEASGLIKYDFLVINQLKDVQLCLELINKKHNKNLTVGNFVHENKELYVWDLPEDLEVYKSIWNGSTESIFQISTRSMVPAVQEILPTNIMHLATILALIRPGPIDCINPATGRNMVEEYYLLRKGQIEPDIKELAEILPETYGVMCFQEQLAKVSKELAGFSNSEAEQLRENMAKKKKVELMNMKPKFMEGAKKKISEDIAETIWNRMETFGRYGFSVIHACFSEDQLIQTNTGTQTLRQAYDSKSKIAYYKDGEIHYEQSSRWFDQGEKEVFEIEMEDGSTIKCTEDHKFMDEDGTWITAKQCMERGYFYAQ